MRTSRPSHPHPSGRLALSVVLSLAAAGAVPLAIAKLPSADGQFWDVQDASQWAQDSGGIATGGGANPFNGFGYLKLQVRRADGTVLLANQYLRGFGLAHDGDERLDSITPVVTEGIVVARALFAPKDTRYLRYVDSFTNTAPEPRTLGIAWGGATGTYEEGGLAAVAITGSGDRVIDASDTFVTVMQNVRGAADPMRGPSGHGPSAHVLGSGEVRLARVGDMYADPFADDYPGFDPAHLGYVFSLRLEPGETRALMTFVVKGLSEQYDPRGGPPAPAIADALLSTAFAPPYTGTDARVPEAGSEIARVTEIARGLVAAPDARGLTPRQRAQIANWRLASPEAGAAPPFDVFEKSVPELQDALARGDVTSEDLVRDYLARIARFDRHGPTFRAMIALNPAAFAVARTLDAERARGTVRGPFHGIPLVFKDNIDTVDLPTTGGMRALEDRRPRLDAHVVARMRRAGAIVLGKTNLDEFPFGDFGISTVGGTIGNAYDPSLSTAGSSGGSAVAAATSMAALGFGTDTCNSLSNPASFASLATIRPTRGLVSRAGVMALNPYNDAIGPMARTVREVALALDEIGGADPEDPVTADAGRHARGPSAAALDAGALRGARIGLFRQRFVGFTGEREAAAAMDRVAEELRNAGAVVIDVHAPGLDAVHRDARGREPGTLKAAWTAYLSRGARDGDPVMSIEDLIATGKLSPAGVSRFKTALAEAEGADLEARAQRFVRSREAFRDFLVAAMDRARVDALIYPANHARPHTHEGGLERYGSEPGTCEESAMTGLPQVTVPAGYLGGRYPFGVSLLGRMWDDPRLLAYAYAYEQATRHRRPPPTVTR